MNNIERIEKRNKLSNEVSQLEMDEARIRKALEVKRKELRAICPCEDREPMFEYSICKHCKEHH